MTPIDSAIKLLKKRKEEASKVDPATTPQGISSNLINNIVGAMSGIAEIFIKHTGKTEIVNQPKVSVSNFPKVKDVDLTPVVKAIKEIPSAKETDINPVVKAIKEIPQTKQLDISPILKAISNLPIPEPVDFNPVVTAIKAIPKSEKFPGEIKVANQIVLDKLENLLEKVVGSLNALKTPDNTKKDKDNQEELKSLFRDLAETISENRVESVRVLNPGDFPVSPSHAAYKKSDGTMGYGLVDDDSHVQVDVLTMTEIVVTGGATELAQTDGTQKTQIVDQFNTNDIEVASATVTYIGTEDKDGAWYVKSIDTSSSTVFGHATVTNNPSVTSYSSAWTNRVSLTYQDYGNAF